MRAIDADALIEEVKKYANEPLKLHDRRWTSRCTAIIEDMIGTIKMQPTLDAVPVVRCKDCKHGEMRKNCYGNDMVECSNPDSPVRDYALTALFLPDWFCADGERKEV